MTDKVQAMNLTPVSRETEGRLDVLVAVLERWQRIKNLVSGATLNEVWVRHVSDSLQLLRYASAEVSPNEVIPEGLRWLDLGSGGGFPGLVIAAAGNEHRLNEVILVESNGRKCAFLREAAREMGIPVTVLHERIEDVLADFSKQIDVVSARALAPLPQLVNWTYKLLTKGAVGLFPKGQTLTNELTETAKCWRLDYTIHNSLTGPTGRILRVTGAMPV